MKTTTIVKTAGTILIVPLTFTVSGCGLLMTTAPPSNHADVPYFSCTESNLGPGLDAVMAGLYTLQGAAYASAADDDEWRDDGLNKLAGISVGLAVVAGVSAAAGFEKTKKCRAAKEQFYMRLGLPSKDSVRAARTDEAQLEAFAAKHGDRRLSPSQRIRRSLANLE